MMRLLRRSDSVRSVRSTAAALLFIAAALGVAAPARAASPPASPGAARKPSLVVVISVDQMRADYLDRFRPWFGPDGFNRLLARGAVYPEARHRHAVTDTAPGHASIGTGLDPRHSGMVMNRWFDAVANESIYCAEDRRVAWVGAGENPPKIPIRPASPALMDGASLCDRLKESFPGAIVAAVALKDRAAVLMAGRKADAAIWFEERFGRFVTSTYYPRRPSVLAYNEKLPAFFEEPAHRAWDLSGRIPQRDLARITFEPPELFDARDQPEGYGAAFPHTMTTPSAIVQSPWGDTLVLGLARAVVGDLAMGSVPSRPDLLFVGLSATDYYGHWFGPDSREIADGIVRLDAELQAFFRWLDASVGRERVMIFLTADHGVTSIPQVRLARERSAPKTTPAAGEESPAAGRVDLSNGRAGEFPLVRQLSPGRLELERALSQRFAYPLDPEQPALQEASVILFDEPCLYMNRAALARRKIDPEAMKRAVRDWLKIRPGVANAYANTDVANGLPASEPNGLAIERSFRADRSGDVFVVLRPGWMWSPGRDRGTTHGQPYDDDARVPLLAWGPGVRAGVYGGRVSPISIARTVAALFGFEAGEADADVLDPVLGREAGVKRPMATAP